MKADVTELLAEVTDFYREDFKPADLKSQLSTLGTCFTSDDKEPAITVGKVVEYVRQLPACKKDLLPEVVQLVKLILVMPATNATSERAFSALRRVKTYLRSTMTQKRLNHLMLLHVHKDEVDCLDPHSIGRSFVAGSEHRASVFGKF